MKSWVNYFVFLLALLLFVVSICHPENVQGRHKEAVDETSWMIHLGVLGLIVIGAGYQCLNQASASIKKWRNKRIK